MVLDEKNHWSRAMDRFVHAFAVLYTTRYHRTAGAPEPGKELTPLEVGILNLLDWDPGLSLKQYAQLLHAPNSTVTSAVNRLENREVLRREIHPDDRRSFRLVLTDLGKELARYRAEEKERLFGDLYDALGDKENREALLLLLEKVKTSLYGEGGNR